MLKIATWNVNSIKVRLPQLVCWLKLYQPDILAIQETKIEDINFPIKHFLDSGYQVIFTGQKAYNGVAILSILPAQDITFGTQNSDQKRLIGATIGQIRIINIYVPNGQAVGSDKYRYKLIWLNNLYKFIHKELQSYSDLVLLGDFNIAPEEQDVYDNNIHNTQSLLCTLQERRAFQKLISLGLQDTLRRLHADTHFTWWHYRYAAFQRNWGFRIDHILASKHLADRCVACYIDLAMRQNSRPSDHAPLVTEFI